MYLVICNISKRNNIGSLLLTAAAFGCEKVFVVGQRLYDFSKSGDDIPVAIRDHHDLPIVRFEKWKELVQHLKDNKILLVGVEIHEKAQNIEDFNEGKEVAFLMGNEGQGIHEKHMASCDAFVKISQYGGGTASLNVYVAASIVLHRYQMKIRPSCTS
mmetsp:Transcript_18003/g.25947  ORF Transcript_18003/g.25947 Transcript_18003/m.25947 type:complete len:158 (-) Transcript_18003:29-502(-)